MNEGIEQKELCLLEALSFVADTKTEKAFNKSQKIRMHHGAIN